MPDFIEIQTTTATHQEAQQIARELVERRLAACAHVVGPIESVYRWQGAIETAQEWQCIAKTRAELFVAAEQAIREFHTYELPQILAVPIATGTNEYVAWLTKNTE